mgnify:CR=1 FL=1
MKQKIIIYALILFTSSTVYGAVQDEIMTMYYGFIDQWKQEVVDAFDKAEKQVYNIEPIVVPIGPNEDPSKCPCRGTGVVVHGDGHTTPCPFHSKSSPTECNCEDCQCNIMEKQ